ncbi:MAG TPA: AAA domain-containing protein [Solirubrobacteraceae bacterium]|nr:AAA domain-containing protein [Solirubrobacteraceae bacterium]
MDARQENGIGAAGSAPPPGWRTLTFRYAGSCGAGCGVPVRAGDRGFWNPATGELRHAGCSPSSAVAPAGRIAWTGLPEPADDWQRLVAYCRACVLREGLAEPLRYEDFDRTWAVAPAGTESILAGIGETIQISGPLRSVIAAHGAAGGSTAGEELAYGWPLVVCRDADRRIRCAPLVIATVRSPATRAKDVTVDRSSVMLNVAVADPRFQPDADPGVLRMIAEEPLPLGSPGPLATRLERIAVEAGLTVVEALDAAELGGGRPPGAPGIYNRAVVIRREPSRMTAGLLADLRSMFFAPESDWRATAAGGLLGAGRPARARRVPVVSFNRLNASQEAAVETALCSPIAVVTGPPGTGKSQFVAALVATARDQGKTILVSSTNNGAVDEAVGRASSAHPATILRTGNADYRKRLIVKLDEICTHPGRGCEATPADARAAHRARAVRRDQARDRTAARGRELLRLDEAARVAADAARSLWGGEPPAELREDPAGLLGQAVRARGRWRRRAREKLLRDLDLGSGSPAAETLEHLIAWARSTVELRRAAERRDDPPGIGEWIEWEAGSESWMEAGRALVAAVSEQALVDAGDRLEGLLKAYRGDDGRQGRALLSFLDVLPAWGTSALSVRSNFACEAGAFDIVVIDEASQCTLPAVLPLAFRAKQLVIVGDPNQLPPVVTVPAAELEQLPGIAGLDGPELRDRGQLYGVDSAFDAFGKLVTGELLLDEHYRCHPEIAGYCDEEFYSGALHILTDTWRAHAQPVRGLEWRQVDGEVEAGGTSGRINRSEAEAIADWAAGNAQALRAAGAELGIVTPFAAQARLLRTELRRRLDTETTDALNLRIGTAHTFQGGERDVMVFSPVISTGVPAGTVDWLEKNRYLVNVAVSRARVGLVVLGDARHLEAVGSATLVGLHRHATSRAVTDRRPGDAEAAVIGHLPDEIDVRLDQKIADYVARLSVRTGATTTVVVIDAGETDAAERLRGLQRDQNMIAAGAEVLRIPAWLCRTDPSAAAQLVVSGIGRGHTQATC